MHIVLQLMAANTITKTKEQRSMEIQHLPDEVSKPLKDCQLECCLLLPRCSRTV